MSSDNVVDHTKTTVEDHPPVSGMVDHQLSAGECTNTDHMVNSQDKKNRTVDRNKATIEDTNDKSTEQQCPSVGQVVYATSANCVVKSKEASNFVDCQKRTVDDDTPTTKATGVTQHDVPNTTQITGSQLVAGSSTQLRNVGNTVDRQKTTVEDDTPTAQVTDAYIVSPGEPPFFTQITGMQLNHNISSNTPSEIAGNMVDHHKEAVEDDTPSGIAGNMVDCHKKTVEDETPSRIPGNMVDCHKKTVEDETPSGIAGNTVDRQQTTVEDKTPSGIAGNTVDRKKTTVEDDTPSSQITGVQPNHPVSSNTPSVMPGNMVPSDQVRGVNSHGRANTTQITGSEVNDSCTHIGTAGNTVDRKRTTIEDPEDEFWKIQLHVNITCSENIIQKLPKSKCFEWNKSVIFGRGDVVDIHVNHDQASRHHVELVGQTLPNGQVLFMTRNISGSKGFNLNGQYITDKNQWMPLNRGDQIKIAGLIVTVDIIPAGAIMGNFVVEFILPQVHHSPVVTTPSPIYPAPYLSNGQPSFYYPVPTFQPFANPYGNFVVPRPVHESYVRPAYLPPNNGMPMQPYWLYGGIQPGQPYLAGNPTSITGDMVEHALQPYREREGYVKIQALRYLAQEAVGVWEELGLVLGLKDWQLTMIKNDYQGIGKKSYQMLKTWVWCNPEQATLENLKRALEDTLVNRGDLAIKYCTVENIDTNLQNNGEENANVPDSTTGGESHSQSA